MIIRGWKYALWLKRINTDNIEVWVLAILLTLIIAMSFVDGWMK